MPGAGKLLLVLLIAGTEFGCLLPSGRGLPPETKEQLDLELLKMIEIERLRVQISENLGLELTEDDPGELPAKLPDVVEQPLLADHRKSEDEPPHNATDLRLLPLNTDLQCIRTTDDDACRRFEFKIPPFMQYNTTKFWMFETGRLRTGNHSIAALCSNGGDEAERLVEHDDFRADDDENDGDDGNGTKWRSFELPMMHQLTSWTGSITCAVEVTGLSVDGEQNLPFLKIAQDLAHLKRVRRSEAEGACRRIPFTVYLNEIGVLQHFVHPPHFNAYVCTGHCVRSRHFYQTVMEMVFRQNLTLEREYGNCWASRCTPSKFENMDAVLGNGTYNHVITLTNIVTKACACQ